MENLLVTNNKDCHWYKKKVELGSIQQS